MCSIRKPLQVIVDVLHHAMKVCHLIVQCQKDLRCIFQSSDLLAKSCDGFPGSDNCKYTSGDGKRIHCFVEVITTQLSSACTVD